MAGRTDEELLDAHRRGDGSAFATLVDRYQGVLLRYVRVLLGAAAASRLADDVVQETLLRLARTPPLLPGEPGTEARVGRGRLSAWLNTVARNRAMELIRSEQRRIGRERTASPVESDERPARTQAANDTRHAVEQGLLRLPADQREVLVLRLLQDKSYRDIAAITGKKIGTIGWLISEGLKSLSASLSPVFDRAPVPANQPHHRLGGGPS